MQLHRLRILGTQEDLGLFLIASVNPRQVMKFSLFTRVTECSKCVEIVILLSHGLGQQFMISGHMTPGPIHRSKSAIGPTNSNPPGTHPVISRAEERNAIAKQVNTILLLTKFVYKMESIF